MKWLRTLLILPQSFIEAKRVRHKSLNQRYQKTQEWSKKLLKSLGYTLEVEMKEDINEPVLLVSNHQSTFDPVMIIAGMNFPMTFVSKVENKKIPLISSWAKNLDLIYFDRSSREGNISMLRQATKMLKEKRSVLIFPEGTRSKSKHLNPFKSGSLQPAKLAQVPIVPVTLVNSYLFNSKSKETHLKIIFDKKIEPSIFKEKTYEEIMEQIVDIIQSNLKREL